MKLPLTLLLPVLLTVPASAIAFAPAQAARREGEAEVRSGPNGVPCFTIPAQEEARGGAPDFQSVTVSAGAGRVLWHMAMPRARSFPVSPVMCIPYAGRVHALPQTPAAALEAGQVYRVRIDVRPAADGALPLRYLGRFCLRHAGGGRMTVHAVAANDARPGCCAGCARATGER